MASMPIGGDRAAVTWPNEVSQNAAVARVISQFGRDQIGSAIEVLVALLDAAEPDADLEENDLEDGFWLSPIALGGAASGPGCNISDPDGCSAGDDKIYGEYDGGGGSPDDAENAHAEWHTLAASTRRSGKINARLIDSLRAYGHEDDELGDATEDDDPREEDDPSGMYDEDGVNTGVPGGGHFYVTAGPGCTVSDDDGYALANDVPMLPVFSAAFNVFNDQRAVLGLSNLMSSYRTNGMGIKSADSGAIFVSRVGGTDKQPGVPV